MMRTRHNPIYRLVSGDYHENFDCYSPRMADFHDLVYSKVPAGWDIKRSGIWFHCSSKKNVLPDQGWKIHVSAIRVHARALLDRVSALLLSAGDVDFKFALDIPTLLLLNGKNWPRAASGKFITIYPGSNRRFLELIEQVHAATRGFEGPYILSDHRFKDSQVVFYRYGGMRRREALDVNGERIPTLIAPDGTEYPDRRLPYPATPAWAESVLPSGHDSDSTDDCYRLGGGRFQINGVIAFSSSGGVYVGTDLQNNTRVIIKEARPCIEVSGSHDAVTLLKKEYRLLELMADTGITPRPIDLFSEGTHWFLVEEYIEGVSLSAHSASRNVLLRTRPSDPDFDGWYKAFCGLVRSLFKILEILQSKNVVFSDLSPNNLIVTGESGLKLIDFESAFQPGVDAPTSLFTPGFVSTARREGKSAAVDDDYYSAGAVLMSYLLPVNEFFHLSPRSKEEFLAVIQRDARLPGCLMEMLLGLIQDEGKRRRRLAQMVAKLPEACAPAQPAERVVVDYAAILDGILEHLLQSATCDRPDRLFPADPQLFRTNPLSLAYGAAGIAYALKRLTGTVPRPVIDWILEYPVSPATYPPGLYIGLSGIAWALLEIGERKRAEELFRLTFDHKLLDRSSDLFYGSAGWGMACLRFFLDNGNEVYLQKALACGTCLLAGRRKFPANAANVAENRGLGLAHGGSGIALFLLYLYLVTKREDFLCGGRQILETDLAAGIRTWDGGLSWSADADSPGTVYPYWRHGSAGVGAAVVRYHKVLGDNSYRQILDEIYIDTDRKHAVLPGRFAGLSGIGDFLLDASTFTSERRYLDSAHQVARAVLRFKVNRQGIAFPGNSLSRLSCDYGTGSAGIALFLNRLIGRQGPDFVLDDLVGLSNLNQPRQESEKKLSGAV
jgi:serine/threonine protein kinase